MSARACTPDMKRLTNTEYARHAPRAGAKRLLDSLRDALRARRRSWSVIAIIRSSIGFAIPTQSRRLGPSARTEINRINHQEGLRPRRCLHEHAAIPLATSYWLVFDLPLSL